MTGVVDEVGDVIVPGAFAATLARRRPKFVMSHDMTAFAGRILHIEEIRPGDKRLPKTQPNGQAWPKAAGALIATMQANMATETGRDAWEWSRFYAESNEAAYSIGYKVPKSLQTRRADGVRLIFGLELYEVSLVLHGANSLTSALEVKSAVPAVETLEVKDASLGGTLDPAPIVETKAAALAVAEAKALPVMERKYNDAPLRTPGNGENWVEQVGGLPRYVRAVARALMRSGHTESRAISMAIGSMKRWAAGGDNVTAKTRAKAAAAVAQWEAMKARAHADNAVKADTEADGAGVKAAGLAVRAVDTGRVLMLQRSLDEEDPAAGTWEFPGGTLEDGEDALVAAMREWQEETGAELPSGKLSGTWTSKNGVYRGHVLTVPSEASVQINTEHGKRAVLNPDDPDGDAVEVVAWFAPHTLPSMPSLRPECRDTPWSLLAPLEVKSAASAVWEAKGLPLAMEVKAVPFDESKHERGKKGTPEGGRFVAKGDSDANKGTGSVSGAQEALIKGGFLGKADGRHGKGDDGLFGVKTDAAVKKWQKANGYEPSGKLTGDQYKALTGSGLTAKGKGRSGSGRSGSGRAKAPVDISKVHHAGITVTEESPNVPATPSAAKKPAGRAATAKAPVTRRAATKKTPAKAAAKPKTAGSAPRSARAVERASERSTAAAARALLPRARREAKSIPTDLEVKSMSTMTGSFEERAEQLRVALDKKLRKGGEKGSEWVSVIATYPDRVIARRYCGDMEDSREAFAVPYTTTAAGVELGEPAPVTLELVAVEGTSESPVTDEAAVLVPAMLDRVREAVAAVPMQVKTLGDLEAPLLALLDGFAAKGMDVPAVILGEEDEEDLDDELTGDEPIPSAAADGAAEETTDLLEEVDVEEKGGITSAAGGAVAGGALHPPVSLDEDNEDAAPGTVSMTPEDLAKDLEDLQD